MIQRHSKSTRPLILGATKWLAISLLLVPVDASAQTYGFHSFEVPDAPITGGRGLDDGSCQVGYYQTDAADFSTAHAIRRCDGQIETIDPPTSISDRRAFDIRSTGEVVGSAQRATGSDGFQLNGEVYSWFEFPGADQTVLRGINDAGHTVGEYAVSDGTHRGFARISGLLLNVNVPLAIDTRARGINNDVDIVGFWEDSSGLRHGFLREVSGIYTTFDFPGATETLLGDINDTGEIVGTYFDSSGTPHGFLRTAPLVRFVTVDMPGSVGTIATGINEAGELTGEWIDDAGIHRGFVAIPHLFADGFESGNLEAWTSVAP
ncbi:MAG: DUF3466 family protein [Deltaproteobacteria bacterium]|nr:DUF3466 family protein [Deltaproteobacteria bacterium]